MNNGPLLFFGILATLASSFWGLLLVPQMQIGHQQPIVLEATGQPYPTARPGTAQQGAEVYRAQGCAECHSQQVRGLGSDLARGLGTRISVAQDYLYDYPVQVGNLRIGPDLANVGLRHRDTNWHLQHFYNPQKAAPGSMMPPYRYLFVKRKLAQGEGPATAALPAEFEPGYEILPKAEAYALVDYMLSLQSDVALFEAPLPVPATNAAPAATSTNTAVISTNAPATSTNNPVTNAPTIKAAATPPK
jgi:cytochrome c oxidase cbb3-type subunit 2